MSEVVFHRLDRELIVQRLARYASEELGRRPEVREVILIGSLARGDWSARSDADIVVIVDGAEAPGPFRGPSYVPAARIGVSTDVFVYTPDQLAGHSARFRGEVERGIVLYRRHTPDS
jgi:predicted nucleotidyltransferase